MLVLVALLISWPVEGAVLDPALYLVPSPPLTQSKDAMTPGEMWSQTRIERDAEELSVIPISEKSIPSLEPNPTVTETPNELATPYESMEKSETFWPGLRPAGYSFGGIHVPLTFSISGSYGRYGNTGGGVIGSSYASVADDGIFGYKSGLAGSSYGRYGTRIFGGSNNKGWSGWGNGKWGHYGKG